MFETELFWHLTVFKQILNWIVLIRTFWVNWISWNRNVLDNEVVLMLKWTFGNKTVHLNKNGFGIKWSTKDVMP